MPSDEIDASVSQLAQISRAITRAYKRHLGRGPDRVHCHYAAPDAIVCFLEGTLTPVERLLSTIDEHQRLHDVRLLIQETVRPELRLAVERITGRSGPHGQAVSTPRRRRHRDLPVRPCLTKRDGVQ